MRVGLDVLGNIAIVKFDWSEKSRDKKKFALDFLKKHKNIGTVLEKSGKFSGRLRTQKTKFLAGENTREALYRENGCVFRFNVDTCYFSPRLSEERKKIAKFVKRNERVLVMFGGVSPFAIVIAKKSKANEVVSVEIGRECSKYALQNVKRNKLENVKVVQGDVKRVISRDFGTTRFDRIVMARPNLKDNFLDVAFSVCKSGTEVHYYGFYLEYEKEELKELIELEAKKAKKKVRILRIVKAGDIGARKFRYRADIKLI
jgi:tRNA (guanine37-N1)-methyltransferase